MSISLWLLAWGILPSLQAQPAPAGPPIAVTNPPLITVQQFLQGATNWGEQIRVRVRGTVTHSISDRTFFIQEGASGVYVFHKPPRPFRVGDLVEVVGSPSLGGLKPTLQYCEARVLGAGPLPIPRDLSIEQARSGEFHMCLVRVEGRLAEERLRGGDSLVMSPGPGEKAFTADLEAFEDLTPFAHLEPGSRLRLTGVCSVRRDPALKPVTFNLFIRSPEDILVLERPSWWTASRTFRVLGFAVLGIVVTLGWVLTLRRQIRLQTMQIQRRLESEASLERRFRELVENANDIVYTHDGTGRFTSFNRAGERMLGYTRETMLTRSILDLVAPERREDLRERIARQLAAGEPATYEMELTAADGRVLSFEISSWLLTSPGAPPQVQGIARNVTERRRAEDEIRKLNEELEERVNRRTVELTSANEALEAFSYSISHDLRAPLRHIAGFAGLLSRHQLFPADPGLHKTLGQIMSAASRMGRLIDDLLAFSRIGRVTMSAGPLDLDALLGEVRQSLQPDTAGRDITWRVAPLPRVEGDPMLLRLVWGNLLSNAIKYTRGRPQAVIEIGCQEDEREWSFFVRDNGAGFDLRYVDRLFGVFQRLHRDEEFEGTGVGLAIVRRIVERHGGRTWAEGKLDQGATFYFTLPRSSASGLGASPAMPLPS